MTRIIKAEVFKILRNKTIVLLFILVQVYILLDHLVIHYDLLDIIIYSFLLFAFVLEIFTVEYQFGTMKNVLDYGKSRTEFYLAKLISISICIFAMLILDYIIFKIIFSLPFDKSILYHVIIFKGLCILIPRLFVCLILFTAMASIIMLISVILKRSTLTILISLVVLFLLPMILLNDDYLIFGKISLLKMTLAADCFITMQSKSSNSDILYSLFVAIITLVIFTLLGILVFKKRDIK